MDLSSALSGIKGGSAQEKKEAIKAQVSSEIAMANVSVLVPFLCLAAWHGLSH